MSNKTIGVTGASGFIGRRIIEIGLGRGYSMIAFVRPTSEYPKEWDEKLLVFKGDISISEDTSKFIEESDIIIHQAAVVSDWAKRDLFQKVSINGTQFLLDHMKGTDKKFVLASSISVYSSQIPYGNCTEEIELPPPIGIYSWSKQEQEKLVQKYSKEQGVKYSIIRPGNVYGPHAKAWVHDFIDAMRSGPILINGGNHKALTYIDNVAEVFLLAALSNDANSQIYNATDDNELSWKEYGTMIAKIMEIRPPSAIPLGIAKLLSGFLESSYKVLQIKKRPLITKEAINFAGYQFDMPYKKAFKELNYKPIINKIEGLKRTSLYIKECLDTHKI